MSTTATVTSVYRVEGMTCGHCVNHVTEEVSALAGVCDVTVDLAAGQVTVRSDREMPRDQIATAVYEAGYQLAS